MSFIQTKKLPFRLKEVTLQNKTFYHILNLENRTVTTLCNKKLAECHVEHLNSQTQIYRTYGRKKNVF